VGQNEKLEAYARDCSFEQEDCSFEQDKGGLNV